MGAVSERDQELRPLQRLQVRGQLKADPTFLSEGPQTSQHNFLLTSLFPSLSEMAGDLSGNGVQIDLEAINGSGRGPGSLLCH